MLSPVSPRSPERTRHFRFWPHLSTSVRLRSRILPSAPSRRPALAAAMAAAPPLSKAEYLKRYLSGADAGVTGGSESCRKRRKKRPKPSGAGGKGWVGPGRGRVCDGLPPLTFPTPPSPGSSSINARWASLSESCWDSSWAQSPCWSLLAPPSPVFDVFKPGCNFTYCFPAFVDCPLP